MSYAHGYVPNYCKVLSRDNCGWPLKSSTDNIPYTQEEKNEMISLVKDALRRYHRVGYPPSLRQIYDHIKAERPTMLKDACLWDWIDAAVHRALLDAKAEQRWVGDDDTIREANIARTKHEAIIDALCNCQQRRASRLINELNEWIEENTNSFGNTRYGMPQRPALQPLYAGADWSDNLLKRAMRLNQYIKEAAN